MVFTAKNMVNANGCDDRLETAMNYHRYLHQVAGLNRAWNSEVLELINRGYRGRDLQYPRLGLPPGRSSVSKNMI